MGAQDQHLLPPLIPVPDCWSVLGVFRQIRDSTIEYRIPLNKASLPVLPPLNTVLTGLVDDFVHLKP